MYSQRRRCQTEDRKRSRCETNTAAPASETNTPLNARRRRSEVNRRATREQQPVHQQRSSSTPIGFRNSALREFFGEIKMFVLPEIHVYRNRSRSYVDFASGIYSSEKFATFAERSFSRMKKKVPCLVGYAPFDVLSVFPPRHHALLGIEA
ncbi:hypothetical protein EYF80_052164 [Liparis tanakae]|uniref:Uncharacterized protein n=1 Tax=Liparis tanakae TaxID=230148 RepID=A0A4Z2F8V5_9TELE|nr:hypothetical protein EYF80_052164 [Liparis tanakae]